MAQPSFHTLSAQGYNAVISSLGAELKSLTDVMGEEFIWRGDASIWSGTAPVLFPIVGRLKAGQYQHKGKTYQLAKHGFARNSVFTLMTDKSNEKSFLLTSSTQTRDQYPFEFEFEVFFKLAAGSLTVRYEVRNKGDETMLFTLGSHPACSLPLGGNGLADYWLEFERNEQLDCYFLDNDLLTTKPIIRYLDNHNTLQLSAELFDNDAFIFKHIQSRQVSIKHKQNGVRLTLNMADAPHFGIWAKAGAPFVCLEPWFSYDDTADSDGELLHKPGMMTLEKYGVFSTSYTVNI